MKQDWTKVTNVTANGTRTIKNVQKSREVLRLWNGGANSKEYFLVEHRPQTGYDKHLPGSGLLVWHIDDSIDDNTNQSHPKVALLQADGMRHLESATNRGDAGDPFPGSSNNREINATSNPNTLSYGDLDSGVSISNMVPVADGVTALVKVKPAGPSPQKKGKGKKKAARKR